MRATKSHSSCVVPLSAEAVAALSNYIRLERVPPPENPVWPYNPCTYDTFSGYCSAVTQTSFSTFERSLMFIFQASFLLVRNLLMSRAMLTSENLALRQQLAVYQRAVKRPQLRGRDRFFWLVLSKFWKDWRQVLIIVKPETAQAKLSALLALEIQSASRWTSEDRSRDSRVDQKNVSRESFVGRPSHSSRTSSTRL